MSMSGTSTRDGDPWRSRIVSHADVPPSELKPSVLNARRHPQNQSDALAGVLSELGWIQSVVVSKATGNILDGHLRVELALSRGEPTVPVVWVDVSEAEEAYALATIDPLSAMAQTDADALEALLASVSTQDDAVRAMLAGLAADVGLETEDDGLAVEDPGPQIDRAAELQEQWQTASGQLWIIPSLASPGCEHRLLCGDATSAEDVARLMAGERAELTLTDPPYNVGKDYGEETDDARPDYLAFTLGWFKLCPSDFVALTPGMVNLGLWFTQVGVPTWVCAWRKSNQCSPSGLQGFNTWEPVLAYGKPPKRVGHDSWDIPVVLSSEDDAAAAHPVPKTVEAWRAILDAFATDGALVYDACSGAGTTHVVAEQTGRLCYGLEISASYCAVILERLAGMGLEPRLL